MKRILKLYLASLFLFGGMFLFLTACSAEQDQPTDCPYSDPANMVFTLQIPGGTVAGTKAMADADETTLKTVYLLAFKDNGSSETFMYASAGRSITGAGNTKQFTVTLNQSKDGNERQRFVLLANLDTEISAVLSSFTTATTKQQALDAITVATSAKWNTTSSSNFAPLPMWGESSGSYVVTNTLQSSHIGTINMLRALARVDVGLNYDGTTLTGLGSTFKIADVLVYNYNNKAAAAPLPANFDKVTGVANSVTIPTGTTRTKGPLTYTHTTPDDGFIQEIYLAESANTGTNDQLTCLVIGGYYNGSATKTYYRVDFYDRSKDPATVTRLPILRNHRYIVNITSVSGAGYPTPDDALSTSPSQLSATVTAWNEADLDDSEMEDLPGLYQFTVSQSTKTLSCSTYDTGSTGNDFTVFTSVSKGWSVEKYTDDAGNPITWLSLSPASGAGGVTVQTRFIIEEGNGGADRKAKVYLKSGRLSYVVNVTQYGQAGDLLYFKSDGTLSIGRWGTVTQNNIAQFKFGSVIGFTNTSTSDTWDAGDVKFNTTGATTYGAYINVPFANFTTGRMNVSEGSYHNGVNVKLGKGDPCKLVGLTGAQVQSMTVAQLDAYNSGWRLPTDNDWLDFIGTPTSWYSNTLGSNTLYQSSCNYWGAAPNGLGSGCWFPIPGDRNATTGRTIRNTSPSGYIPAAGYRDLDGSTLYVGSFCNYWSGSSYNTYGFQPNINSTVANTHIGSNFAYGFPVRCVRQ